jgi:hypothetical protein
MLKSMGRMTSLTSLILWKIKTMFETTKQQSKMLEHVGISSQTNDA